jgi:hypothetical protein
MFRCQFPAMRVSRFGAEIPTVGSLVRQRLDLSTWCKACDRRGRTLVAEDLAVLLGPSFYLSDLGARLRCSRCGTRGHVEIRVCVRDNRQGAGWNSDVLPAAIALAARVILEQQPELEAAAPALAEAVVRTLYRAGYL